MNLEFLVGAVIVYFTKTPFLEGIEKRKYNKKLFPKEEMFMQKMPVVGGLDLLYPLLLKTLLGSTVRSSHCVINIYFII